jgi:hypothetical protein
VAAWAAWATWASKSQSTNDQTTGKAGGAIPRPFAVRYDLTQKTI